MLTIICIGTRDNLSRQSARERGRAVARLIKTMAPSQAITLEVAGYDNDERELWDIPEVRRYVIKFTEELLRHGITLDRLLPQACDMIRACCAVEAGNRVIVNGTLADTVKIGIDQVRNFITTARSKLH